MVEPGVEPGMLNSANRTGANIKLTLFVRLRLKRIRRPKV